MFFSLKKVKQKPKLQIGFGILAVHTAHCVRFSVLV